ncbi:DUF5977 domain-containing protein [Sphingobacterium anhuiense]|uniref:DUF5977 domain-containing protein n=1 Tax=Sphingobacterium anhuiense TaxID=493780 RepID=UPI003C30C7E6
MTNVVPQTAEVSSFQKYSFYPVSYNTGVVNINVPLHNIVIGDLSLPLSLDYHTGGIKVEEKATHVGLGWILNSGGLISVIKNGGNDTRSKGYPNNLTLIPNADDTNLSYPSSNFFYSNLLAAEFSYFDKGKDLEPDEFSYLFNGESGVFYLNNNNKIVLAKDNGFRIEYLSGNDSFIITDKNGVKYYFDKRQSVEITYNKKIIEGSQISFNYVGSGGGQFDGWNINYNNEISPSPGLSEVSETTSWSLSKIVSANEKDSIILEYDYEQFSSSNYRTGQYMDFLYYTDRAHVIPKNTVTIENTASTSYSQPLLKSIQTSHEKIEFIYSANDRLDKYTSKKRLTRIIGKNAKNTIFKEIDFNNAEYFISKDGSDRRLKLSAVSFKEPSTTKNIEKYEFKYFENELPNIDANSQDFWGYHNGIDNSSLIPRLKYYDGVNIPLFLGSAVRSARQDKMTAFSLHTVYYPTGGLTRFIFTGHLGKKNGNKVIAVGGLKISQSILYPDATNLNVYQKKKYTYKYNGQEGVGKIYTNAGVENSLSFHQDYINGSTSIYNYYLSIHSSPTNTYQPQGIGSVEYDEVIEEIFGSGDVYDGKIVYNFSRVNTPIIYRSKLLPNEVSQGYLSNLRQLSDLNGGVTSINSSANTFVGMKAVYDPSNLPVLIKESIFNNKNILLEESDKEYITILQSTKMRGMHVSSITNNFLIPALGGDPIYQPNKYEYFLYEIPLGIKLLSKDRNRRYFNGQMIESSILYTYTDSFNLLKKRTTTSSNGTNLVSEYKYAFDYNQNIIMPSNLVNKNILKPISRTILRNNKLIDGEINEYDKYGQLVSQYKSTKSASAIFSKDIVVPDGYIRERNLKYVSGRVVQMNQLNLPAISYVWGYNRQYPIGQATGIEYESLKSNIDTVKVNRSGYELLDIENELQRFSNAYLTNNNVQLSTYLYDPMVGITSKKDISSIETKYGFDRAGRLNFISDGAGSLMKKFDYNSREGQVPLVPGPQVYYNIQHSQSFTKNNCTNGAIGQSVTYTIPASTYLSTKSQAEADSLANVDLNNNGQDYANLVGECNQPNVVVPILVDIQSAIPAYTIYFQLKNSNTGIIYSCTSINNNQACSFSIPSGNYIVSCNASQELPIAYKFKIIINGVEYDGGRASMGTMFSQNLNINSTSIPQISVISKFDRLGSDK